MPVNKKPSCNKSKENDVLTFYLSAKYESCHVTNFEYTITFDHFYSFSLDFMEACGNRWKWLNAFVFIWFHTTPFNWTILIELWRHRLLRRGRLLSYGGRGQQVCRGLTLRPDPLDTVPLRQRRWDESSANQEVIQIWYFFIKFKSQMDL